MYDTIGDAIVSIARVDDRSGDQRKLRGRNDWRCILATAMVGEKLPEEPDVQPHTISAGRSRNHAVEILGVTLNLRICLVTAGGAAGEIRSLDRRAGSDLGNSTRWSGDAMDGPRTPDKNAFTVVDTTQQIVRRGRLMPGIAANHGIAS